MTRLGNDNKMGTEPLWPLLLTMSIPSMFSMLIQSMYNIVDSYFVAQISEPAFRAVTLAMPVQQFILAVAIGSGVGLNSYIARSLGAGEQRQANEAVTHGYLIAIVHWLFFVGFHLFLTKRLYAAFTSDASVAAMGESYLSVILMFSFGVLLLISSEKILQATGDMIWPMFMQLTGAVLNIVLDPFLIFGLGPFPELGVRGAAIATVLAQCIACAFAFLVLALREHKVEPILRGFRVRWSLVREIYRVGVPSIVVVSIPAVMVLALNQILRTISESLVSVLGIYFRLQSFVFMPVFGLTQGMMPIIGYNYGAQNRMRIYGTLRNSILFSLGIMGIGLLLFQTKAPDLLHIFNATEEMLVHGSMAIRTISWAFLAAAVNICMGTYFQAIGYGVMSLILSFSRQLLILLPAAWLLRQWNADWIWAAFIIAEMFTLLPGMFFFRRIDRIAISRFEATAID